ncbi:hypothetical protein MTO96_023837 [Rhipicephalus appendiculatus]
MRLTKPCVTRAHHKQTRLIRGHHAYTRHAHRGPATRPKLFVAEPGANRGPNRAELGGVAAAAGLFAGALFKDRATLDRRGDDV